VHRENRMKKKASRQEGSKKNSRSQHQGEKIHSIAMLHIEMLIIF
jgi:hypothetical protein